MNSPILLLSLAAAMAAQYSPFFRNTASGIPTPPRRNNQRQRRRDHRRARPHGWKGGAK